MQYKVCLFYDNGKIKDVSRTFPHHEPALVWALGQRRNIPNLFGIIIYRRQKYINYFLTNNGWKMFELMQEMEYCIVTIEGWAPIITQLSQVERSERIEFIFPESIGMQLSTQKLVLTYTGDLGKRAVFAVLLHEIGHAIFDYKTNLSYNSFPLRHELEAWGFALNNCDEIGICPDYIRRIAKECIDTYIDANTKKKYLKGCGMSRKHWWKRYKLLTKHDHKLSLD